MKTAKIGKTGKKEAGPPLADGFSWSFPVKTGKTSKTGKIDFAGFAGFAWRTGKTGKKE